MLALTIGYQNEECREKAQQLALKLDLALDNTCDNRLVVTADKLVLDVKPFTAMYADFSQNTWQKRHDAGKKQGLVKACKPMPGMRIIDVTAGWGRDAAVLASFGANVVLIERNPVMAALLEDALARQDELSRQALQLKLIAQDARNYLNSLSASDYPDLIYFDPMHPTRQKSALVKKDLQVMQTLIGEDRDALEVLELAITRAKKVVVKWPQHLPPLMPPTSSIPGKTVRFDCYSSKGNIVSG
ncbi:class I SAM-dependent methyltransferase [Legionella dresdenensis]|uniref:Ribosomal RNA small subunit methyltransferase J n=1 Tax=Legionella dresdenensis TaxID=450200 RepID=A0ABV8CHS7_9GAMM